jgi:DHA1 family tetracycline resistance protein-like MFS transporter
MIPVLPFVIETYGAPEFVYGLMLSLYAFFQFIGSPILGKLSDSIGRKPVLIISHIGTLLSWVIFGLAYFLPSTTVLFMALPLWIIAFARITDGITGGNISVANAYVSDITTAKEKSTIFGYLGGVVGIGLVIGPGIGGISSSTSIGYLGTIIVAAIISLIALISIFLFLKESLPSEDRRERKRINLKDTFFIIRRIKVLDPKRIIKQVLIMKVFIGVLMAFYISTVILYIIYRFDYDEREVGMFMLMAGLFLAFNQAFVYKFIVKRIGELKTLTLGFFFLAIGFSSITYTDDIVVFTCLYYFLNLGISITMPVFNSLIAQHTDKDKIGEIMGVSESISSLSNALIPVFAAYTYSIIKGDLYFFLAAIAFTGMIVAILSQRSKTKVVN